MEEDKIREIAGETKRRSLPFYLDGEAVRALIGRVAGRDYADKFIVREMPSQDGYDGYALYCEDGKIRIDATSGSAAASAFDCYLKRYCDYNVGFLTTAGTLPSEPPLFCGRVEKHSAFHYRYLFNYCTFAYSFAFSGWGELERVLDCALLSGYNLILNPIGHESVWKALLEELGYTPREIRRFLVNPAFLPFLWMMNMSDYDAAYPADWFEERASLARKFNERLASFGVGVMLPGYCGMVPDDFKKHFSQSSPIDQGLWNGMVRPGYLLPDDCMFDRVADLFYGLQKKLVGGDGAHYYSVDPFHEGGISDGIDLCEYAKRVMAKMKEHDEKAVWFFQGWQDNPKREMLRALDKRDVLVGNLLADTNGASGDDFAQSPWLYCNVNNFGAQHVLRGNIERTLLCPFEFAGKEDCTMVGIGYMPEGVENDEIFFDLFATISIERNVPSLEEYLTDFVRRRYKDDTGAGFAVWRTLAERVYTEDNSVYPGESVFLARPSLEVDRVSSWGRGCAEGSFDGSCLVACVETLFAEYERLSASPSYRFDLTDLTRQCLAEAGWKYARALIKAYRNGDREAFLLNRDVFFELFRLQIGVVSSDEHFLLGKWLDRARACGKNEFEKRWFEFHAREQITVWSDERSIWFHDYAAKEWQGMLEDFYLPRWERFVSMLERSLHTGEPLPQYRDYDREIIFSYERKRYPTTPLTENRAAVGEALAYLKKLKANFTM